MGRCFAQNVKTLDDYYARLDAGQLAVIRDLICHFHLDFVSIERRFGITFDHYFAWERSRLLEMQNDGLRKHPEFKFSKVI